MHNSSRVHVGVATMLRLGLLLHRSIAARATTARVRLRPAVARGTRGVAGSGCRHGTLARSRPTQNLGANGGAGGSSAVVPSRVHGTMAQDPGGEGPRVHGAMAQDG